VQDDKNSLSFGATHNVHAVNYSAVGSFASWAGCGSPVTTAGSNLGHHASHLNGGENPRKPAEPYRKGVPINVFRRAA
jgi:hypothetical protein